MRPVLVLPIVLTLVTVIGCSRQTPSAPEVTSADATETVAAAPESPSPEATDVATSEASSDVAPLPAVYVQDGVAIAGADPVSYFTEAAYVPGREDFTYDWSGATWYFSSAANRDTFAADPAAYAPQYGGFCAWAVSQGYTAAVDPEAWKVVDNKLYLNYDKDIQAKWEKDIPGNIAQADANWPEVAANE